MGYESLSTVIVLAILVIVMVGWLPGKTVDSMKRVVERRQDRFSSSLHLVDENSGMRFSDGRTYEVKEAVMQPQQSRGAQAYREHVAQVRKLRREAIRRRRILVLTLAVLTLAVFGMSFVWHFNPLFALIPLLLLAMTLALGVRAARQAQEWERHVAAHRAGVSRHKAGAALETHADSSDERRNIDTGRAPQAERDDAQGNAENAQNAQNRDDAPTDIMEQREIRRALRRAQEEGKAARLQHQSHAASSADAAVGESARKVADKMADKAAEATVPSVEAKANADASAKNESRESAQSTGVADAADVAARKTAAKQSSAQKTSAQSDTGHMADASDATSELERVHAAAALDAFDMATQQDLISFSLGAPRNVEESAQEPPESLEIKSMRQVAKAVPQDVHDADAASAVATAPSDDAVPDNDAAPAIDDADQPASEQPADTTKAVSQATRRPVNDAQAFHRAEVEADVKVPDATSDSLGSGIEAVLARRAS
ncbi:MAG: hypothetical protein LKF49_04605 [Bifidobacterium tibiigranuli]|jgi:hypothetical protein|uniref:hypothetical protein n=1 Tax=Bifidobacterium tibiigranuli TaxID=2172043 RepID=UPI0023532D2D|nr:hypothetical protein [Bifidobacterium tibiigranuli]MCH3975277.1 hypothetical protein [Bifidobacterium tibiigranuli]MCH4203475.1 hypothetical protein [Bifidobacterium tibiigranuli]MCH4273913.1 hypothetical protein [Bifidobacterium tibiigranuli]MCI1791153.1 hypothetical protein [Bifidobacterium tibiigranuli]MCI1798330.1 hypothetical protein [Bifidobacterium tibiigranuli]